MKTVFAKILSLIMVVCLVGSTHISHPIMPSCKEQSHCQMGKKSCHQKEEIPSCCSSQKGKTTKHSCCEALPFLSYARLEKSEENKTISLLAKKEVLPTIVSPFVRTLEGITSKKVILQHHYVPLLLSRNLPVLFQQFLC